MHIEHPQLDKTAFATVMSFRDRQETNLGKTKVDFLFAMFKMESTATDVLLVAAFGVLSGAVISGLYIQWTERRQSEAGGEFMSNKIQNINQHR